MLADTRSGHGRSQCPALPVSYSVHHDRTMLVASHCRGLTLTLMCGDVQVGMRILMVVL